MAPHPTPERIAIFGGGAGGLELAIRLGRHARRLGLRLTLVDERATHLWKPRLHEVATGLLVEREEQVGYAALGARHGFRFVLGGLGTLSAAEGRATVLPVPRPDPRIGSGAPELIGGRSLGFDAAVVAIGSVVNDHGTPGVAEHCFTVDTPEGAARTYAAILAAASRVSAGAADRLRVVVVGAGATGVELAAELRHAAGSLARLRSLLAPDQLEMTIVEMGGRVLAGLDDRVAAAARRTLSAEGVALRLHTKVERVQPGCLHLGGGGTLAADIIVWASGTKGQDAAGRVEGAALDRHRLKVDRQLRVLGADGAPLPRLYALGDAAACPGQGGKALPATAQVAHQQGRTLARSLAGQRRGRPPLTFRYRDEGALVSLGRGKAAGEVGDVMLGGATAKLAYLSLYQAHLALLFGWWRTGLMAAGQLLRRGAAPSVKVHWG